LGSSEFMRVRIGIGKPVNKSRIEGYVLDGFEQKEAAELPQIISIGSRTLPPRLFLSGMQQAMANHHAKNISN